MKIHCLKCFCSEVWNRYLAINLRRLQIVAGDQGLVFGLGFVFVFLFGPLLFLIYINDIHNSSAKLSFYLFADDTSLLYADSNLKSLEKTVNSELLKVSDWLNANKLTLNAKKSNYVIFRPYQRKLNYSVNIEMIDNCTQIPTRFSVKTMLNILASYWTAI